MAQTLDTLIAAARAELDPHPVSSDAGAAVRGALRACAPRDSAGTITTAIHAAHDDPRVVGEQALIERILAPVIENAYRHADRSVSITVERDGSAIQFAIDDDGPGIAPAEREAIFAPGHRNSSPSAAHPNSAGLGLALSRRLARSAGGDVNAAESRHGARFLVRLPAA
jgi:signal transduction histidine kinase